MGFPRVRCVKAAIATSNQGPEQAMNWLMDHMDDADIDVEPAAPSAPAAGGKKGSEPKAEDVEMLMAMGFTPAQAAKALRKTVLYYYIFLFITIIIVFYLFFYINCVNRIIM